MHKDHRFLYYLMYVLIIIGLFLTIIHTIGWLTTWYISTLATLPLWGNMEYTSVAVPNINIGLLLVGIGMGISMRNRLGWWIANMMLTILFSLSFAFGFTWLLALHDYYQRIEIPLYPIMPIIQSVIFCSAVVVLSISLLLYLFTKEVKVLFDVQMDSHS